MKTAVMILGIFGEILAAVKAIEAMFPQEPGQGESKLAFLRELLEELFGDLTDDWEKIAAIVSLIVKWLNKTGVFK